MKKYVLIVVSILLVASMLAGCGSKAASLITVSGKIANGTYELTEATFTANATELQYHDPWVGDSGSDVMEKGILLKDLITLVKPSADAKTVALICTDGRCPELQHHAGPLGRWHCLG
jgi:hypothetical protein